MFFNLNLMRKFIYIIYRVFLFLIHKTSVFLSYIYLRFIFYVFNISCGEKIQVLGFPRFILGRNAHIVIGNNFKINSGSANPIGRNQRSLIYVGKSANVKIGNNVGMSSVAIVCQQSITIGDNVRIGGNTVIYDTDFHSLNSIERTAIPENKNNIKKKQIIIGNNVFIGGHCTILKGVQIGDNSIIGAGSVVTKSVPSNEIWGGNPVKFLADISR